MEQRKQIVVTKKEGKYIFAYMIGEKIYDLIQTDDEDISVGNVYVGRVKNIVDNISAAFVEIKQGVMGFLPVKEACKKKIKSETDIVVQVKKPAKGSKDVVLTTDIELVGRYLVAYSGETSDDAGEVRISAKISDEQRKTELRELALNHGMHDVMIRTNACDADDGSIISEWNKLNDHRESIRTHKEHRTLYSCLYRMPPFYIRLINSYRTEEIDRIVTDIGDVYEVLTNDLPEIKTELYDDESYPMDARFSISLSLERSEQRHVWLKSGASLVIDKTEAMTVIDVNSSKAVDGKRVSETTFLKINLEAAQEVARQLRLRNISGIIMVDFIDMKKKESIDTLISALRKALSADPVRASYIDYTKLGIIEITRARK